MEYQDTEGLVMKQLEKFVIYDTGLNNGNNISA